MVLSLFCFVNFYVVADCPVTVSDESADCYTGVSL